MPACVGASWPSASSPPGWASSSCRSAGRPPPSPPRPSPRRSSSSRRTPPSSSTPTPPSSGTGPLGKAVRGADPKTFDALTTQAKELFGVTPAQLKTVTAFWPQFKAPPDRHSFGVVLTFHAAYDQAGSRPGSAKALPKGLKHTLHTPSDTVAVVLVGLDASFARPRPGNKPGPLTAATGEAATGKHALVAGVTLASLPDEIRGDNLPEDVRPFQSLLHADTIVGTRGPGQGGGGGGAGDVRHRAEGGGDGEGARAARHPGPRGRWTKFPQELGKDAEKDPAHEGRARPS